MVFRHVTYSRGQINCSFTKTSPFAILKEIVFKSNTQKKYSDIVIQLYYYYTIVTNNYGTLIRSSIQYLVG